MHLIPFKGRNESNHSNLNLIYNDGKTFIMDNHLAASWCWLQKIDLSKQYSLFHIDRHYDLLDTQTDWWVEELNKQKIDLATISIDNLTKIKYSRKDTPTTEKYSLFRWDNYLTIFNRIYPNIIDYAIFTTHKDGAIIKDFEISEREIYELPNAMAYWISQNNTGKWIVNLDIDYFFSDKDEEYYQLLTDGYILRIAEEIKKSCDKIEVFTLALSPEMCGDWENAIRVTKIITDHLGIEWGGSISK